MDRPTLALALSAAALVPAVYGSALPPLCEVRARADDRGHLEAAQRWATLTAGGLVLALSAATRSPEVAAAGVLSLLVFASAHKRAREANPLGSAF